MGLFDSFSKAKENVENRRRIAEYTYDAQQYINEGKEIYQNAYIKMQDKVYKLQTEVDKFVDYKKSVLREMNSLLESSGINKKNVNSADLTIKIKYPDISSVRPAEFLGGSALTEIKMIFDMISPPRISDFFDDTTGALYEARAMKDEAKLYKQQMRNERERLNTVIAATSTIKDYIQDEKRQMENMMATLRTAVKATDNTSDKRNALIAISNIIADTLTTNFMTKDFVVTKEYDKLHKQIASINENALSTTNSSEMWISVRNMVR